MTLLAAGLTQVQLARRLGVSPRTVRNYKDSVMQTMGAPSILSAIFNLTESRVITRPLMEKMISEI